VAPPPVCTYAHRSHIVRNTSTTTSNEQQGQDKTTFKSVADLIHNEGDAVLLGEPPHAAEKLGAGVVVAALFGHNANET
jgi:hypothetical protein